MDDPLFFSPGHPARRADLGSPWPGANLVFAYEREAEAAAEAANVLSDGQTSRTWLITWVSTPRVYRQGRLIVLYVGCDARILAAPFRVWRDRPLSSDRPLARSQDSNRSIMLPMFRATFFGLAVLVLAGGIRRETAHDAEQQALDAPAPAGSFAPQLARSADGSILLSWLETADRKLHRFRVARLRNGNWDGPITITEGAEFFANWADVPSVSEQAGVLYAHWLEKNGPGTYAYEVKVRASRDGGRTWGSTFAAHADRSQTEHGFASFFTRPDRKAGAVWLDGRATGGHSGHGAMTLRASAIGSDGSSEEKLLDDRVCDCCPTTATSTPEAVIVAYRDRSTSEVRDISVVRFANGVWSTPITMKDNWQIGGCPVNGPSLASRGSRVSLAWFTAASNKPAVKVARSANSGRTWSAPVTISEGVPLGRVAAAITPDGATHVLWLDHNDANGRLLLRRLAPDGTLGPATVVTAANTDRRSGVPRLIANGNGLLYAWTEVAPDRTTRVRVGRR